MVKSSRRPTNIRNASHHLEKSEIKAKLPFIPVISVPSPVLETADKLTKNPSATGRPKMHNTVPPIMITIT